MTLSRVDGNLGKGKGEGEGLGVGEGILRRRCVRMPTISGPPPLIQDEV